MQGSTPTRARCIWIAIGGLPLIVGAACAEGPSQVAGSIAGELDAGGPATTAPREAGGSVPSSSGSGAGTSGSGGGSNGIEDSASSDDAGNSRDGAASCSTACTGCCDPSAGCAPGIENAACGLSGAACMDCTATGGQCQSGTCTGGGSSGTASSGGGSSGTSGTSGGSSGTASSGRPRMCSALNCFFGCCQNGTCVLRPTSSACGRGGTACVDCSSMSKTCSMGQCR
jgi:hypothetical protein